MFVRFLLCALVLLPLAACSTEVGPDADGLIYNAQIYTMNPAQPTAEAMAWKNGEIVAVGMSDELLEAYPEAEAIDARQQTVVPGLIDAHGHLMGLGETRLSVDLAGTTSKADIIQRLQAFEANLPAGAWLTGRGWDQNDWPEQAYPTAADLDAAFPDRPVWLGRIDGHAGWANTAAMEAANLDPNTSDPEGGRILRDASGAPTGVFIDTAEQFINAAKPPFTAEERMRALQLAIEEANANGLTGMHDAGVDLATIDLYKEAIDDDRFDLRVYAMIGGAGETFDSICADQSLIVDYGAQPKLTVRSVKYYIDGALGSRGAALLADYTDEPGNQGLTMVGEDAFTEMVEAAIECGLQVNTHAIGDRGNRMVLDAYEAAMGSVGNASGRHRIEHAQIVAVEDIPRFSQLGIIASMQPTHATSDMYWAGDRVGEDRLRGAYAWRTFADQNVRLAFGSDFPVEQVNPLLGFYAAVTRQDAAGFPEGGWYPEQAVSRMDALRGFTLDAAYAGFMEDQVGSLEAGKMADFVIFSQDLMEIPARDILDTYAVATFLGGEKVYDVGDRPRISTDDPTQGGLKEDERSDLD